MKKIFFPVALMALAIGFNACSSDDVTVNANGGGLASFAEGGYAKVSINLPSSSNSNRAGEIFDDGLASEYQVKNAKLVLFQGKSEGEATFHSAYDLNVGMEGVGTKNDQITTTTRIISRLNNDDEDLNTTAPTGPSLYALVVLNDNGLLEISENGQKLTFKGKTPTGEENNIPINGKKLADLQGLAVSSKTSDFKSNGLLMTNAPLADAQGGNIEPKGNVVTLVDFTNSVYTTEAEAQKNPATDVYVERAVAKVTMNESSGKNLEFNIKTAGGTSSTSDSDVHFIGSENKKVYWKTVGWDLDVTNNSSYLVRNTTTEQAKNEGLPWNKLKSENVDNYRFVGSNAVKTNSNLYRTYWAVDPNYNKATFSADDFTYLPSNKTDFTETFGSDNPKYCFENTFDVDHQVKQGTTRVMVKVQLTDENNPAETFYTFNGDNSRLYKQGDFEKRIKAAILREPNVEAWVKKNNGTTETASVTLTFKMKSVPDPAGPAGATKEVYDRDAADGQIHLTDFTVKVGTDEFKKANLPSGATMSSEALAEALNLGKLVSYEGGYAYYPIRIKHFGTGDTPWNKEDKAPTTEPTKGATTAQIYPGTDPTRSNNYLGRYGVLRNNWYEISVSKISAIGSPVVPGVSTDKTPDDDFYNYIAVRINILSWAKHSQSEEL